MHKIEHEFIYYITYKVKIFNIYKRLQNKIAQLTKLVTKKKHDEKNQAGDPGIFAIRNLKFVFLIF